MNGVRYPSGLIAKAVSLYVEEELSAVEVARRLGLRSFTVKGWMAERGLMRSMSEAAALSVVKRPRGRSTSKLWYISRKDGTSHFAESSLEFLRMQQLDLDRSVVSWERCPHRISYLDPGGVRRTYVPDFFVSRKGGRKTIEEINPSALISAPLNQAKFAACRLVCARRGWKFLVLSERDVGYARAIAPSSMSKSEQRARQNERRKQRWKNQTGKERTQRLTKNAKYMRGFRARSRQK